MIVIVNHTQLVDKGAFTDKRLIMTGTRLLKMCSTKKDFRDFPLSSKRLQTDPMSVDSHRADWSSPLVVHFVNMLVDESMMKKPVRIVEAELVDQPHDNQVEHQFREACDIA